MAPAAKASSRSCVFLKDESICRYIPTNKKLFVGIYTYKQEAKCRYIPTNEELHVGIHRPTYEQQATKMQWILPIKIVYLQEY